MIGILDSSLDHGMMSTGRYGSFGEHTFPKVVEGTFVSANGVEYTLDTTRPYNNLKPRQATALTPEEPWHIINYKDAAENISFDWHSVDQSQFDAQTRPIRPFRRIISSEEWAARRIEITDLYRHRGWTLPRVMQEMSRRGFHGSKKQYKNRITEWGLDKNVKRAEAEAILSEHRRRTALGEPCIFVARGWLVDVANLERFSKRAGLKSRRRSKGLSRDLELLVDDEDEDEEPTSVSRQFLEEPQKSRRSVSKLPQDVRCIVLPPSYRPVSAPSDLETLRALLHHTSVLFHSFFDRDVYALAHPSSSSSSQSTHTSGARRQRQLHLTTTPNKTHSPYNDLLQNHPHSRHRKRATDYRTLDASYDLTLLALSCLRQGNFALAGQTLEQAFAGLDEVVTSDHPNGIGVVIKTVGACYKAGFGEVGEMVVRYVRELGRVRFDDEQSGSRQGDGGWWEGGGRDPRGRLYALLPKVFEASASNGTFTAQGREAASTAATTTTTTSSSSAQKSTGSRTTRSGRKRQSTLPLSCAATLDRTDDGGDCDRNGGGGGGGGSARTEAQSHLVSVYELFCQDLWRKKRPENSLLVLLWYPSLFCW